MLAYADTVAEHFGTVNLVFNNAGIAFTGTVEQMSFKDIDRVMDVDFWGVVNGTKAFLPHLIASGDGHVVNVSSVFGLFSVPTQSAYNAAKFAVRGFTESLRQEMINGRRPVKVTCVHPGGIKTNIARNGGQVDGLRPRRSRLVLRQARAHLTGQGRPGHPEGRREEQGASPDRGRRLAARQDRAGDRPGLPADRRRVQQAQRALGGLGCVTTGRGRRFPHPPGRRPVFGDALGTDPTTPLQSTMAPIRRARDRSSSSRSSTSGSSSSPVPSWPPSSLTSHGSRRRSRLPWWPCGSSSGEGLFTAYNDETNWSLAHDLLKPAFTKEAMRRLPPGDAGRGP